MQNNDIIATTIRQRLAELASSKILERKKGIDGLKEYLYDDEAVTFLNESSGSKSSPVKWDSIFGNVAECLILACDGARAKKTSKDIIVAAQGLLWTIISKANTSCTFVSASRILTFVTEVWENPQLRAELEDFSCNLIVSQLLEREIYWSKLGVDKWRDLVGMAFDIHSENSQDRRKTETSLTILLLVLRHGTYYSTIALTLKKKIFTFIVQLLQDSGDLADNDFLKNNLVSQLIFLSTELGAECKAALCKAGELLLPRLIRLIYEQQKTGPTLPIVSQLYKALLVQYNAHHPLGVDSKASAFTADVQKWNDILKRVYYMIDREIARLQRSKVTECSDDFIHLTVHLVAWFYDDTEDSPLGDVTLDTSVSAKRVKLTVFNIDHFIQLLRESSSPYDIWPVLHVLACLVFRYPKLITPEEYKTLLQMFSEYQCNNFTSNEKIMDYLYEGFFALFLALKHVPFPDEEVKASVHKIWKNVFLRLIGLNQCVHSSQLLLRYLLSHRLDLCHPEQLIKSYTDKVVSLSEESLKTLFYLISKVQTSTETRLELVAWLLHDMENLVLADRELADHICPATLFMLCSNTKPDRLECLPSELDHFFAFLQPSSLEYFYAASNFDQGLFTGNAAREVATPSSNRDMYDFIDGKQIIFNSSVLNRMHDCFKRLVHAMENKLGAEVIDANSVQFILNNLSFWICFCKYIQHLPEQSELKASLIQYLPDILRNVLSKLSHLSIISTELYSSFLNVFHSINQAHESLTTDLLPAANGSVIKTYLCAVLAKQLPSGNILETVMPINTYPKEMRDLNFHKLSLTFSDKQLKIFRYVILLTQYLCNDSGLVDDQKHVISRLFEITEEYLMHGFKNMHLLAGAYLIHNVARIKDVDSMSMEFCIVTFLELCRTWQKQSDVIEHVLLPLLKLFFSKVQHNHASFRETLVDYLTKFYKLLQRNCFGSSVQIKIVECFGFLAEMDPRIEWALSSDDTLIVRNDLEIETMPLILETLAFVRSPFHSVRMKAIEYLTIVFQSSTLKRLKVTIKEKTMFTLLTYSLEKILELNDDFTESEYVDESVNRTASFLHAIACVISACPCFSRQALHYSFVMFVNKKLNQSLFKKILSLILKHMNITTKQLLNENMFYMLSSWYQTFGTFRTFPFVVLYSDGKTFFKANAVNIVTILYLNENSEEMNHYAQLVSKDAPSLLKLAIPKILALGKESLISSDTLLSASTLETRLEEVVLNLLSNVIDYKHLNIRACVPASCITHINLPQLESHMDVLMCKLDLNLSPIEYLCENNSSSIQRLHLHLSQYIYEARSFEFQIEAIHRYAIFLQLLKPVFSAPDGLILDFLVHSVVYTLLHTLSAVECSGIVLSCFDHFLHDVLPQCSDILVPLLPGLVKSLIPMTQLDSDLRKTSLNIIEFLVVQHSHQLRDGILALDPFPQTEEFETISQVYNDFRGYLPRTCLHKEIGHFVKTGFSNLPCKITERCRLEGLNNINYLLTHQRQYLNKLNESSLSDCELETLEKMLNRLVVVLSELATSPDENISRNAIVCLGKIGPYCMNPTTALAVLPGKRDAADIMLTQVIASNLILYLGDDNIKVVSIASEALYNLLDSPEGYVITNKLTPLERKLIYPMLPAAKMSKISLQELFDASKFKELVDVSGHWVPYTTVSHEQWISHLASNIINSFDTSKCYLRNLIELCSIKTDFAEKILSYLVYFILRIKSRTKDAEHILSERLRHFFSSHQKAVHTGDPTKSETEIHVNKKSVKCLLDVVHFVRVNQDTPDGMLLNLNYLHVAQAATFCSAPYSAILFAHFSSQQLMSELGDRSADESLSPMDYICNHRPDEGSNLQDILRDAYTQINDIDAVHGCGNSKLAQMSSRMSHYKIASNWQRVLECSDSLMSAHALSAEQAVLKQDMKLALSQCGLYFIQTQLSESQDYDACWRLSQWDCPDSGSEENSFEVNHYRALKCLNKGETVLCVENINAARRSLVDLLNLTDMEYAKQVQPVLSKLQMLQEIEEFVENKSSLATITKWEDNQFIGNVEFKLVEPILSQRSVLLKESNIDTMHSVPYHLKIAQKARIESHFHIAERILHSVDRMSLSNSEKFNVLFEQAQLFWDRNEREVAKFCLRNILPDMKDKPNCERIYFKALRTYGCWQASTNSENLRFIMQKYLEPALEALPEDELEERLKTYDCLARYADEKHVQISESLRNIEKFHCDASSKSTLEMRQQALDTRETAIRREDRKLHLLMAMEYYIKSLAEGNLNDIKIFRVVSLWLENTHDADVLRMLLQTIMRIPSYKFVKVLPQLVGRISNLQTEQNLLILQVIEKCAVEHPHHTLPLIMAVANSLKDEIYLKKESVKNATMDARIKGAEYLLMKLKKQELHGNNKLLDIIKQQEVLSLAYIIFANYFLGKTVRMSANMHTIPSSQQLVKISDFDKICVSTLNLKLNPDGVYKDLVGIHKFDRTFSIPGGINEPKKITCIGTDGRKYIQLLKGKDDPRQDAVMQQVFTIMNDLLQANKTACKRNLSVQTYKVVPLSQMSGVIEWCNDSLPIYAYLAGESRSPGAHARYNPKDLPHEKCREKLESLRKNSAPTSKKLSEYLSICKRFKPVFRYFFLERCKHPREWHRMQTNYTRSVATSSMVGYILGLGDRHLNNILISLITGQVIHIDFGIAFEQGYILPTPETVPFRLSRDIEDGMGVTGTEGTFKRTCETTLSVLRDNSETILSILEVLLYDPLYTWTLTPTKVAEKQRDSSSLFTPTNVPVNKIAARALFRLKQKLLGIEDGIALSVEAQTNILILRAKDPERLCSLFPGWQPYL